MKKGEIYQGIVEKVEFPNKGCVRTQDGETAIVKNVIEGQTVEFIIQKIRKGKCEGRLLAVLKNSPWETGLRCAYFGQCGGCVYQPVAYEKQLELKASQVKSLLAPVVSQDYAFEGILASPCKEQYRNKMEFSFGDACKGGPLELGLHKRNSMYDVITVDGCRIVDEDFSTILSCVKDYFTSRNVPYYHKMTHEGSLRHLLVRKAVKTGEILVDLVTTTAFSEDLKTLSQSLQALPLKGRLVGFLHTWNDAVADVVKNEKTDIIFGADYFYERLLGLTFKINPFSFFQTNSLGAEVLYTKVREYVGDTKDKVIFDLYSGTGTIAQILAPVAKRVVGVEIVGEAVEAAKENAALNGLSNCEFISGDVLKVMDELSCKPDIIVLDPPRDGIHPKALEKIIAYGVEQMVYISCKPTSLARDLAILQQRGYRVEKAVCVDMFPGTVHVETVVLLSQKHVNEYLKVSLDLDELDITASESEATYEEIKEYIFSKYGVKVSTLYISQIKRKNGIEMRDNYNKSQKAGAKVPQCPPEKEKYIVEALKHFKMI